MKKLLNRVRYWWKGWRWRTPGETFTWTGEGNVDDWHDPKNWDKGQPPGVAGAMVFPAGSIVPMSFFEGEQDTSDG